MIYPFIIEGDFVPYVRMTQRGKWVKESAQRYLSSQEALGWQFKQQMAEREMIGRHPFFVIMLITGERIHIKDLDNQQKALMDAMQGIVFEDDRWCDGGFFLRHDTDLVNDDDGVNLWVTDSLIEFLHDTEHRCHKIERDRREWLEMMRG